MTDAAKRMYPTMSAESFDNRAQKIVREAAETPAERRYAKMLSQQATERTDTQDARAAGWKRATPQDLAAIKRYPGMAGRSDLQLDDPKDPTQGGWIRTRTEQEGLSETSMKMASKYLGRSVKGY